MSEPVYNNDVNTDNLPISDYLDLHPLETDNFPTSDETNVSEDTVSNGTSTYSVNKRKTSTASKATTGILLTLSVSAIAGGSVLSNTFLGTEATVDTPSYVLDGNTLSYDIQVTNTGKMKVYLILLQEETEKERVDLSETNHYQGSFTLLGGFVYTAQIQETNRFDFKKVLYTNTFSMKN